METQKEKLDKHRAEQQEAILKELAELPLEENFVPPLGLGIPLGDEVILLPIMQNETKRASGIIMPSTGNVANDRKMGIVARIGPLVVKPIKIGMKVIFENRGNHFRIDGTDGNEYLMILQHNIFCAATPQTYIVPEFKTKLQLRDDERKEGFERVRKDEQDKLNKPIGES